MISAPKHATPSNWVTNATAAQGHRYVYVTSDGNAANTHVRLSDGTSLGLVQKVSYTLELGSLARCTIDTIASPAEVAALMEQTTVHVQPWGSPVKWLWVYYTTKLRGYYKGSRFNSLFRS